MRIEGSGPPYLVDIGRTAPAGSVASTTPVQGAAQTPAAAKPASQERVVFSAKLREIASLKQQLAALPEVRPEKVALAKQQLQSGLPDGRSVAQSLMEAHGVG
ncbi:hypothetical protein GMST_13600 [Geomonas silvestris]|uniref:Anti-sigma-28 factor FlgM C-terminal domain-containing protein n=1 Tax=Geomonas silvestris TaxID=2740184 RepID=A0A6V8MGD1_9BACT|nr:flagellar biosynthesis anti-sigma factor FlgM [Geomonas silvestris]GFO59035.1 hypothetical protein GMST_13600 [Geomonas silvestris]